MNSKFTILLVDDTGTLRPIREILLQENFKIISASSAEEALDLLENQEASLVISDLKLSGMSGSELLHELHEWDSMLPVILVGESGKEKDWLEAVHANASALLSKQCRKDALLKAVHKAIHEKKLTAI